MEMVTDRDDQRPRVNKDKSKDQAGSEVDSAQSMESSSSVSV